MERIYQKVDEWFNSHKDMMVEDIARLVRIPSVSNRKADEGPFGKGCRDCLDEMLAIGREHGFDTKNYEYYVGSIGNTDHDWSNTIGFWNHLDVVPVGNDWTYPPFEAVFKEPFLIGRGSQDNKGPAIGILYMMKCLRELAIPINHELCLFVGCDEEQGMGDMEYYASRYPLPALSMIADSGFPVCYGEKGIIEGWMRSMRRLSADILDCGGGNASNMIPDRAYVKIRYSTALEEELSRSVSAYIHYEVEADAMIIRAVGTSKHSAFPEGSRNAIHELSHFMASLQTVKQNDRDIFAVIAHLSKEYYGAQVGIAYEDEVSGKTTCAATVLRWLEDGYLSLHFNIRYAITDDAENINAQLLQTGIVHQMDWQLERNSAPNYFPKENPIVQRLTDVYNEITGEKRESFVMGGGTYARKLPNAFAYGVGGMTESAADMMIKQQLFDVGHGNAHEPDEGLNVRLLLEAMKIYTMSVIALNEYPLT